MVDQIKERETEFFDRFDRDGGYDRFGEVSYASILVLIRKYVNPQPGQLIIDMGCGTGALTKQISDGFPGTRVMGIDLSPGCISRAKRMYSNLEFRVADAENTGLEANSVDVISFFGLLHHFPDFEKVAIEARRILKTQGRFFSFDPHHYNPVFWLYRAHASPFYSPVGVTSNERLVTKREVVSTFTRNGFNANARVTSGIRFTYVESPRVRRWLWLYNFFDRILGWTPLVYLMGAWVVGWGEKKD